MFDKLKQLNQIRQMQAEIKKQRADAEIQGVRVVVNGSMQIEEVKLNPELSTEEQERLVKECFNQAVSKIQASLQNMMGGQL